MGDLSIIDPAPVLPRARPLHVVNIASKVADDAPPQEFIVEVLLPKTTDWKNEPFGKCLQLVLKDVDAPAPTKLARS